MRRNSNQEAALALAAKTAEAMKTTTGQWGPCADVRRSSRQGEALAVAAKACYTMNVHHVLVDLEEETRGVPLDPEKETREVPMDPEEETWEVSLDLEEETREGSLDPKDMTREVPLDSKEETQEAPSDPAEETREAPSDRDHEAQRTPADPKEKMLEAPSDPEEETQEAPSDPEEETREVPSDHEEEAKGAAGPTELEGPVVPAHRKLTISGNLPPNHIKAHVESAGGRRRGRSCTAKFSADERRRRQRECVDVRRRGHDGFLEGDGATGADSEGHVPGAVNRQQAMNALEMEKWKKVRKKKCKVARPNDKFVVGARVICNSLLDRTERSKSTGVDLPLNGFGRSKRCTTHPPQRQRESGYL